MAARRSAIAPGRSRGFALLIVLWTLVLIGLIAGHLAASGRIEARIAGNLSGNAAAEAARDGAVQAAIFNLSDPNPGGRWQADGAPHALAIGASRVVVRIVDEAGRVNPNLASPQLLEALLAVTGSDPDRAHRLALATGEWISPDKTGAGADAAAGEYQAAGLDYAPPLEPLQTIDELARVVGMTPETVDALRPHLTLYGPAQPDPAAADGVVRAALDLLAQPGRPRAPPAGRAAQADVGSRTLRIIARAQGPGDALSAAAAIVRLSAVPGERPLLLGWDENPDRTAQPDR